MLAITKEAAAAVDGIITSRDLPDEAGVRLSIDGGGINGETGAEIRLDLASAPESGDQVLDEAPVFLDPAAATALEDKLLDAEVAGDEIRFALREQAELA